MNRGFAFVGLSVTVTKTFINWQCEKAQLVEEMFSHRGNFCTCPIFKYLLTARCPSVDPSWVFKLVCEARPCNLLCLYICQDNMLSSLKNANEVPAIQSSSVNK